MPAGPYKARHPLDHAASKGTDDARHRDPDHSFSECELGAGAVRPGEALVSIEATKGFNGYYLTSDGYIHSYRTRIRTPSFAHLQMIPLISRGFMVADLMAIFGSIDFVMSDVDR